MNFTLTRLSQLTELPFDEIIDVRSPSEYAEDHIPGALSLPVLSDAERAEVGTIYTRESRFKARKIGAALVAANAARHLQGPLADREGDWRPLVYCWRGGQRSNSFASILDQIGWRTGVIHGGYRSYRRLISSRLHDEPLAHRLILLDGNTGTAKTELLALLAERGHQVLDLEAMAAHRGSIFGDIARPQPSQKAFESALAAALVRLDPARSVIVEAESSRIGRLVLPPALWQAMLIAPRLRIRAPLAARAEYLSRAYNDLSRDGPRLEAGIEGLRPFQSAERIAHWHDLARNGRFEALAAELMEQHYDPRYEKSTSRQHFDRAEEVAFARLTPDGLRAGLPALGQALDRLAGQHAAGPRDKAGADPRA